MILRPLLVFSSTVPSILITDALPSALYVALIVNCQIMISHKRYILATHDKLQGIISKSLTHLLIISYLVRDLANHFLSEFLISKLEFSQQFSFFKHYYYYFYFIHLFIYFSYFILPGTFKYIGILH